MVSVPFVEACSLYTKSARGSKQYQNQTLITISKLCSSKSNYQNKRLGKQSYNWTVLICRNLWRYSNCGYWVWTRDHFSWLQWTSPLSRQNWMQLAPPGTSKIQPQFSLQFIFIFVLADFSILWHNNSVEKFYSLAQ